MARIVGKAGAFPIKSGNPNPAGSEFICPECGDGFARPASLGAHRRQAHGVPGRSARTVRAHRAAARAKGDAANTDPAIVPRAAVGIETDSSGRLTGTAF